MIDTGAEPNVIKIGALNERAVINRAKILKIAGVTANTVTTVGSVIINIWGNPIEFLVVPDAFPTRTDGIIGSALLQDGAVVSFKEHALFWQKYKIKFKNSPTIPTETVPTRNTQPRPGTQCGNGNNPTNHNARNTSLAPACDAEPRSEPHPGGKMRKMLRIKNWLPLQKASSRETPRSPVIQEPERAPKNPSIKQTIKSRAVQCISIPVNGPKEGYISRIELSPGIVILDCIARNINGRALVNCINLTESPAPIKLHTIQMEEFDDDWSTAIADSAGDTLSSQILENRLKEIEDLIKTEHLNPEELDHVQEIIDTHHDLFHLPGDKLGKTNAVTHKIPTTDENPIRVKQYRYPQIHKREIDQQMKELLSSGIVEPSSSPYNSPLWIVPKKPDANGTKRWRMVIDYRALNEKSIADAYPLPNILEILDQLGSAKYFSVFDLASGFHQIGMNPKDAEKTAFSTPFGHYEFKRMPFGLKNAPATFQRLMDAVLTGLQGTELFVYLDDIVIYARSLSEHREKFEKLARRLRKANLKLQPSKCAFLQKEVAYLGHRISEDGVRPSVEKLQAVKQFPTPKNVREVREFLGLAGYYRRFIDSYSRISKPLTNLLKKDHGFDWDKDQERAFTTLRDALCKEPVLAYPNFDLEFNVTTDASGYAVGAVLSQGKIGTDRPIAYASRLLNGAELNYSTIEKECLALVYAVQHFRPYLYGRKFNLITDHRPLVWMNSVKDPTSRLLRWRLKLAEFDYNITYRPGKINTNADALSRNPIKSFPLSADPASPPANENPDDTDGTETPNDHPNRQRQTIIDTRDRLIMRTDNIAGFISLDGHPLDAGMQDLALSPNFPTPEGAILGRAAVKKIGPHCLILLPIKETHTHSINPTTVTEALRSLLDVATELNLPSISISSTSFDELDWSNIKNLLASLFSGTNTTIFICNHKVRIPYGDERTDIITQNHASIFGGHKGITKTYRRIREKYYWPSLKTDVKNFVNTCEDCQRTKLTRLKTRQPMTLTDTPGQAFDKVSLDIVGPLHTTPSGFSYILTMQDLLTKFSIAVPLRTTSAIETADAFIKSLICRFGAPRALLTDQGSNFTSSLVKAIARKFKITKFQTTAFRPQSNGSIERSHQVLTEYLKQYVKNKAWDEWLDFAILSYNTSTHEGTLYTPHELVYGRLARMPSAGSFPDVSTESYAKYLERLQNKLSGTITKARENLISAKIRAKRYYDRGTRPCKFSPNDQVFILREPRKNKLESQYTGPHKVLEILQNGANIKVLLNSGKIRIIHSDKAKLAKRPPSTSTTDHALTVKTD